MQPEPFTLLDPDGAPQLTGTIAAGKLDGALHIYERGAAQASMQFVNGKQDGPSILLYAPHRPMAKTHYRAGRLHGAAEFYSSEGTLTRKTSYHDGLLHGIQQDFYADGPLFEQGAFHLGAREGLWQRFHRNGIVMERSTYAADLLVKAVESFDKGGMPIMPPRK